MILIRNKSNGFAFLWLILGTLMLITAGGVVTVARIKRQTEESGTSMPRRETAQPQESQPEAKGTAPGIAQSTPASSPQTGNKGEVGYPPQGRAPEGGRSSSSKIDPTDLNNPELQTLCLANPGDPVCLQHYLLYREQYDTGNLPDMDQPYFQQLEQIYGGGAQAQRQYLNPLNNPDINPMANPEINPLMNPQVNPLADPQVNPMADPGLNPGCISCQPGFGGQANPYQQPGIPGQNIPGVPGGYNPGGFNPGGAGYGGWGM